MRHSNLVARFRSWACNYAKAKSEALHEVETKYRQFQGYVHHLMLQVKVVQVACMQQQQCTVLLSSNIMHAQVQGLRRDLSMVQHKHCICGYTRDVNSKMLYAYVQGLRRGILTS